MTSENLYVGIDVSKSKHDVAIINEQKELCGRPLIIQENRPSYQTLVTPLQKKGEGRMRHKLFMIVLIQIRYQQNPFYRYYRRLVDSGKPKLVAIGATMRKLLVTIYAMLKNRQNFDSDKV